VVRLNSNLEIVVETRGHDHWNLICDGQLITLLEELTELTLIAQSPLWHNFVECLKQFRMEFNVKLVFQFLNSFFFVYFSEWLCVLLRCVFRRLFDSNWSTSTGVTIIVRNAVWDCLRLICLWWTFTLGSYVWWLFCSFRRLCTLKWKDLLSWWRPFTWSHRI